MERTSKHLERGLFPRSVHMGKEQQVLCRLVRRQNRLIIFVVHVASVITTPARSGRCTYCIHGYTSIFLLSVHGRPERAGDDKNVAARLAACTGRQTRIACGLGGECLQSMPMPSSSLLLLLVVAVAPPPLHARDDVGSTAAAASLIGLPGCNTTCGARGGAVPVRPEPRLLPAAGLHPHPATTRRRRTSCCSAPPASR